MHGVSFEFLGRCVFGSAAVFVGFAALPGPSLALTLSDFQAAPVQDAVASITRAAILGSPSATLRHETLPGPLCAPAGVFVTVSRDGITRGCWGTIRPRETDLAAELFSVARRVRFADWRARPIDRSEWQELNAYVSVVGGLRSAPSSGNWSPRQFGLWVTAPGRGAVVLPGEAATVPWQVAECRRKAGLSVRTRARLYCFETAVIGPISLAR
jgi:AMMECR1 domain-containing protein